MAGELDGRQHERELRFAREQGFFDRSRAIRLLLLLSLGIAMFLFLHFREVWVEMPELESEAAKYVVAQVDFDFFDEEATTVLRMQAANDIDKIYRVNEDQIRERRREYEKYLAESSDWRQKAEETTYDMIYSAVEDYEEVLIGIRFTDPRTLQKMRNLHLPTSNYQVFTPKDIEQPVLFSSQIWLYIQRAVANQGDFPLDTLTLIGSYYQNLNWKIEEDTTAQRTLRKLVQAHVPNKYSKMAAGSRIIDQNEKVSKRHIAMLQAMKRTISENRNLWHPVTLVGSALMTLLLMIVGLGYLRLNYPDILHSNHRLFLYSTIMILSLFLAKAVEFSILNTTTYMLQAVRYPIIVPFSAILLCSLFSSSFAAVSCGFLTILLAMTLPFEASGFLVINLLTGLVAILTTRSLNQRKEIFTVCIKSWLTGVGVIIAIHMYANTMDGMVIATDILGAFLFMLATAVLVVGLLPLFETGFQIMTDVTLMELMNPNHELLRRLSIEAPGTYQHSLVVGTLAEAAANAIGANGLFCRVSCLYHDVGKLVTPHYFTENQPAGMNMHQLLTPIESAQVIIAHVSEGVAMGRKMGLPEQFIDIIKEHHGTTLVSFFYQKQIDNIGGDASLVNEKEFRYDGPKPRSKESAIIMIADTFEAASRSLDEMTQEALTDLMEKLVKGKGKDGQFNECKLTFEELEIAKRAMIKTLVAAGHSRIKYPNQDRKEDPDELEAEQG
jgi:putative nucleotidyltransferase with HDIG domain